MNFNPLGRADDVENYAGDDDYHPSSGTLEGHLSGDRIRHHVDEYRRYGKQLRRRRVTPEKMAVSRQAAASHRFARERMGAELYALRAHQDVVELLVEERVFNDMLATGQIAEDKTPAVRRRLRVITDKLRQKMGELPTPPAVGRNLQVP